MQEVWQAYQVSQEKDFYYLDQVCNFSPNNTYEVRGKKIENPTLFSNEDWSAVGWSNTDKYCTTNSDAGDLYTACDYVNYATRYQMNLQPYSANGQSPIDPSLITLIQETPSYGVTNLSDCSIDGCSCEIVTNSQNPSLSPVILSSPVPSTDYTG